MGGKKRNSNVVEEGEGVVDMATENTVAGNLDDDNVGNNNVILSPLKKKVKKDKQKEGRKADGDGKNVSSSIKPMERRKKRKVMDKERHRSALEKNEDHPKQVSGALRGIETQASMASSASSSGMPDLRLSVFNDLASGDVSVRQAAAETLVKELQEVQKAYHRLGDQSVKGHGLKLEANKDDGLNDCAPSLRYAIRRLIRGVSSSREVCFVSLVLNLLNGFIAVIKLLLQFRELFCTEVNSISSPLVFVGELCMAFLVIGTSSRPSIRRVTLSF